MNDVISVISMLSVENIMYTPKEHEKKAAKKHSEFINRASDHLTMVNILNSYCSQSSRRKSWARDHYLNDKSLLKAVQIKDQLISYLNKIADQFSLGDDVGFICPKEDLNDTILETLVEFMPLNIATIHHGSTFMTVKEK